MGPGSHDLGAYIEIHSFIVNCDTLNEQNVAVVAPLKSVEETVTCFIVQCFGAVTGRLNCLSAFCDMCYPLRFVAVICTIIKIDF